MNNTADSKSCPNCGETLQPHWKICPACEHSLGKLVCPQCQRPVKERWKSCPECQATLLCPKCGNRLPSDQPGCPLCLQNGSRSHHEAEQLTEPATGMDFVRVPGGKFLMGDTFSEGSENELPVHEVRMDTFFIGRYPVTQSQWNQLMPENPSHFRGHSLPVEQVAWDDIQVFIRKLTEANPDRKGFRLPTEAEWEYAARSGGRNQRYAGGNDADAFAWYENNSNRQTQPVGAKSPNDLSIFDMSGNIWERCQDRFSDSAYESHAAANPLWEKKGQDRVIRGGGWNLDAWSIRCTRRMGFPQDYVGPAVGFRLVMEP